MVRPSHQGKCTLKQASGQPGEACQEEKFSTAAAKFVKIIALTNYSNETPVSLSEVAVLVADPAASDKILKKHTLIARGHYAKVINGLWN